LLARSLGDVCQGWLLSGAGLGVPQIAGNGRRGRV